MATKFVVVGGFGPFAFDDSKSFANGTPFGLWTDKVPAQAGEVVRYDDIGGGGPAAPSDAAYVVVSLDGDLSDERRLQVGKGLAMIDGGANGDILLGVDFDVKTKVTTYTLTSSEFLVLGNGTFTVTLPAISSYEGISFIVKNIGTGTVTVAADGSETIDGSGSVALSSQYDSVWVIGGPSEWHIV